MKLAHAGYAGLLAAAIVLGWLGMQAEAEPPAEALRLLQSGGYTIYFRHAATEPNPNETSAAANEDCAHQRNLSAVGREQARRIGAALRALDIPVSQVLAGPLCRTMETARLIFGRARSEEEVRGGGLGQPDYPGLRHLVTQLPPAGSNTAIVGHGHQFQAVAGQNAELAEGEAAIVKADGKGGFRIVARIGSDAWARPEGGGKLKP
jgi:phosphohistidine phosphatase SixA